MPELLTVQQVDPWLQFNPYIVSGYRPRMTIRAALRSFFGWHNESFNIWTHAIAACFVFYLTLFPPAMDPTATTTTTTTTTSVGSGGAGGVTAMAAAALPSYGRRWLGTSNEHLAGANPTTAFRATCLVFIAIFICSVVYHLFMPCPTSEVSYRRLMNCDVTGVVLCITATSWSFLYRGNACSAGWTSHAGFGAVLLSGLFVLYCVLFNATCGAIGRLKAIGFHCALRLSVLLWIELPKVQSQGYHQALHCHAMSYVFIALGGVIGGFRFPERQLRRVTQPQPASSAAEATATSRFWRWVGRFLVSSEEIDYMWNSHTLWHYCIMLSTTMMLLGFYYDVEEYELARC
ncbi:adiponectin receptor [Trypanosoma conorhini]|uniref:Adiponectin receptor n=1 Tax=Trypanosoma conorhini TaxID=83891 RepID=A0A3R7PU09_9TRYP|nr:adiponectin receptor [Trypanosoma conorhini]RNF25128.1 adiponectin receptor [Trypanosoma conorhini]